jgi:hypothetical protein
VPSSDLLVSRFPRHEFAIRRLYVLDPEFCAVCDDYGAVQRALEHWQAADVPAPGRVAEYRRMLEELEAEALTFLNASGRPAGVTSDRQDRGSGRSCRSRRP